MPTNDELEAAAVQADALAAKLRSWKAVIPTPPPVAPLWASSFETGTFSGFDTTAWNNLPTAPAIEKLTSVSAGKYTIPGGGNRCESVPTFRSLVEGDNLWFSWSTMLAPGFPMVPNWQVINQWKNDGQGSPPLELKVDNGTFAFDGGYGWPGSNTPTPKLASRAVGPAVAGVWDNWVAHIIFSSDPTKNAISVWRNNKQVISAWHLPGGTLYPNLNSYLKIGYYRDPAITTSGTVYHANWKITDSNPAL